MSYSDALAVQYRTHEALLEQGGDGPILLFVEHDPVVTVSRRRHAADHLLASSDTLSRLGIDVQPTDRGGDITYHGPGQLVVYPILRLAPFRLTPASYMRLLEQAVMDTLATFGIAADREPGATGVWVHHGTEQQAAKICAMGVRIRRGITLHGLALNVDPNLDHFQTIVPCGLVGWIVTSLKQRLADQTPSMALVKQGLTDSLARRLGERKTP